MNSDLTVFNNDTALAVSTAQKFATRQHGSRRANGQSEISSGSIVAEIFTAHLSTRSANPLILNPKPLSLLLLRQRLGGGGLVALLAKRLVCTRSSIVSIPKRVFGAEAVSAIVHGMHLTNIKRYICLNWSDFESWASDELKRAISSQPPKNFSTRSLQVSC